MNKGDLYRLLIVDDEGIIREGLRTTVEWSRLGFVVAGAMGNGDEALRFMDRELPDIILTDIRMPVMDGLSLLKAVKARHPEIRVIMLSGYDEFSYIQEALRNGADDYILKVALDEDLERVISRVREAMDAEMEHRARMRELSDSTQAAKAGILLRDAMLGVDAAVRERACTELERLSPIGERYCSCVCMMTDESNSERRAAEILQGWQTAMVVPVARNEVAVVISVPARASAECHAQAMRAARKLLLESSHGAGAAIGVGGADKGWHSVHGSYRQARNAANLQRLDGQPSIREWSEVDATVVRPPCNPYETGKLVEAALRGDEDAVRGILSGIFEPEGAKADIIDFEKTQGSFVEMISMLNTQLRERGIMIDDERREALDSYSWLLETRTMAALKSRTMEMMAMTARAVRQAKAVPSADKLRIVVNYVRNHAIENPTLNAMAEMASLSPSHFSVVFRKYTGDTFTDYLLRLKMGKARDILLSGEGVAETARFLGYEDVQHFGRMFKRFHGISPGQVRALESLGSKREPDRPIESNPPK